MAGCSGSPVVLENINSSESVYFLNCKARFSNGTKIQYFEDMSYLSHTTVVSLWLVIPTA
jgi:hypothetical protein